MDSPCPKSGKGMPHDFLGRFRREALPPTVGVYGVTHIVSSQKTPSLRNKPKEPNESPLFEADGHQAFDCRHCFNLSLHAFKIKRPRIVVGGLSSFGKARL